MSKIHRGKDAATRAKRRGASRLYLLGSDHRRRALGRLTFGTFKIQLTDIEVKLLNEQAEAYLRRTGTLFGFGNFLAAKCS